jgi:hypothetical protein
LIGNSLVRKRRSKGAQNNVLARSPPNDKAANENVVAGEDLAAGGEIGKFRRGRLRLKVRKLDGLTGQTNEKRTQSVERSEARAGAHIAEFASEGATGGENSEGRMTGDGKTGAYLNGKRGVPESDIAGHGELIKAGAGKGSVDDR